MPAVPPLIKPMIDVLTAYQLQYHTWNGEHPDPRIVSQLAIKIMLNPKIDTKRKLRYHGQWS